MVLFFTRNIKFKTCILISYRLSISIFPIISFDVDFTLAVVTGIRSGSGTASTSKMERFLIIVNGFQRTPHIFFEKIK